MSRLFFCALASLMFFLSCTDRTGQSPDDDDDTSNFAAQIPYEEVSIPAVKAAVTAYDTFAVRRAADTTRYKPDSIAVRYRQLDDQTTAVVLKMKPLRISFYVGLMPTNSYTVFLHLKPKKGRSLYFDLNKPLYNSYSIDSIVVNKKIQYCPPPTPCNPPVED